MASRRTGNPLVSGTLFVVAALVAGFVTAAFTNGWVWSVVAGVVGGAAAEWVYMAVRWKAGRRSRGG